MLYSKVQKCDESILQLQSKLASTEQLLEVVLQDNRKLKNQVFYANCTIMETAADGGCESDLAENQNTYTQQAFIH